MRRKLEIIRGLMHYPRVLFLDEPTSGLDTASRRNLWQYIAGLRKQRDITICLTTHQMDEAEDADSVCIIDHGRLVAIGGRDLLKFFRDPGRLVAAVVFPFTMIFLLGGTLQLNLGKSSGFNFIGFAFTGFLGMTLFQSTAQGLTSLMEDRQNDFAQEVFVSPVSRYSIVFGKIVGETLVALVQVIPFVLFAWMLRVPLTPAHVALLVP